MDGAEVGWGTGGGAAIVPTVFIEGTGSVGSRGWACWKKSKIHFANDVRGRWAARGGGAIGKQFGIPDAASCSEDGQQIVAAAAREEGWSDGSLQQDFGLLAAKLSKSASKHIWINGVRFAVAVVSRVIPADQLYSKLLDMSNSIWPPQTPH